MQKGTKPMQTRLALKKQRELFVSKVNALLLSLGAQQQGDEFIVQTKVGKLTLHPTENRAEGLGTVFTRFDDEKAARQLVDCNPFSGKWNFHFFGGWTVETAIENLSTQLQKVL
jgi:hypothetical protein